MKLFYRLILLRIYDDGRISNQTSIHPTEDNASVYAYDCLTSGSVDGFVVIEESKDTWSVVNSHLESRLYYVNLRGGVFRIERQPELVLV